MNAGDLLVGPRGRRLCHEAAAAADRHDATLPAALYGLREACNWAMYWQEPDDTDVDLARSSAHARLRTVAEALAADPATDWWDVPVDLEDQHVVDHPDESDADPSPPALTGLAAGVRAGTDEHSRPLLADSPAIDWRSVSGIWWSAPVSRGGVATTRSVGPTHAPLGLVCVEDSPGWATARSWRVRPVRAARILELRGPDDWVELVRRYPLDVTGTTKRSDWWRVTGRDGAWAMPDWAAVAAEFDGVHLTVTGYLTTAGRSLDLDSDTATVLAGWPPDATFWFRDILELGAGPSGWSQDDNGDWRPAG